MESKQFIEVLKQDIQQKSLLKHPFYQLWNEGKLTKDILQRYCEQYYKIVDAWPQWISASHSNCPDQKTRQLLVKNLAEEELGMQAGDVSHSDLWIAFGKGLGLTEDEIISAAALPETATTISVFSNIVKHKSFAEAVGALYAYEQQVPAIATTKQHGLEQFYGITNQKALAFFEVHSTLDIKHVKLWEYLLEKYAVSEEDQLAIRNTLNEALDSQLIFLDGVYRAYVKNVINIIPENNLCVGVP